MSATPRRPSWEILLGGRVIDAKSSRQAAIRRADRDRHHIRVRRYGWTLQVRHKRTGEEWQLRRGSWIRVDAGARIGSAA